MMSRNGCMGGKLVSTGPLSASRHNKFMGFLGCGRGGVGSLNTKHGAGQHLIVENKQPQLRAQHGSQKIREK